jgi:predicted nucleotidyltransferase
MKEKKDSVFSEDKVSKYLLAIVEEVKKYNPRRIILFGSRARKDNVHNSDIDIALDLNLSFREQRKLKEKLNYVSGLYSVDVVFLSEIKDVNFKNKILEEGIVLYKKE